MNELSLRQIQLGELAILKKIKQICAEQDLRYFLLYGTLLGAIRHKGFIPWDDDVDIGMPRDDYEKLIEYCRQYKEELKPFELLHWSTSDKYIYPIARFCDTRYRIEYSETKEYGLGLFVDIYPLDGWGDTENEGRDIYSGAESGKKRVFLAGLDHFVPSKSAPWRTPFKLIEYCLAKTHSANYYARKLDEYAKRCSFDDCTFVGNTNWASSPRERIRKENLAPIQREFEDEYFSVPAGFDEILRNEYGDYMQLPPEEERVGHHYYRAYLKQEAEIALEE